MRASDPSTFGPEARLTVPGDMREAPTILAHIFRDTWGIIPPADWKSARSRHATRLRRRRRGTAHQDGLPFLKAFSCFRCGCVLWSVLGPDRG